MLRVVMFVQFFGLGATYPILSYHLLKNLQFSGQQAGLIASASAISAIVSPIIGVFVADRLISARTLFSLCNFSAAALLLAISQVSSFALFLSLYCLFSALSGPSMILGQALIFHHLPPDERSRFAGVRVWATAGWLSVAWVFGYGWVNWGPGEAPSKFSHAFLISAACALFVALYSLRLPKGNTKYPRPSSLLPTDALAVFRNRQVWIIFILAFAASFLDRFFYFGAAPYLINSGFADHQIMPLMSIGQFVELFAMGGLSYGIQRFGAKRIVLLGASAHVVRFLLLTYTDNGLATVAALACHGIAFAWMYTSLQIVLDHYCDHRSRAGVLLMLSLATSGVGSFLASNLAGFLIGTAYGFTLFWFFSLIVALAALMLTALFLEQ